MTELNSPSDNTIAFPKVDIQPRPVASEHATPGGAVDADDGAKLPDALAPVVKTLHDTVDLLAGKVAAVLDGFTGGVSTGSETASEWVGAARQAVREHPFAALGTALLIGAAVARLSGSSRPSED